MTTPDEGRGRSAEFSGGTQGGGGSAYIASSLPKVIQAPAAFDSSGSVLQAANKYSGVGNGSSSGTLKIADPYSLAMRDQLASSGSGTTEGQQ